MANETTEAKLLEENRLLRAELMATQRDWKSALVDVDRARQRFDDISLKHACLESDFVAMRSNSSRLYDRVAELTRTAKSEAT